MINNLSKKLHLNNPVPPPEPNERDTGENSTENHMFRKSPYKLETFTSSSADSDTISTDSDDLDLDMNQGISWKKKTQYIERLFDKIKTSKKTVSIPFSDLFSMKKELPSKDFKNILSQDRLRIVENEDWSLLECLSHQRYSKILPIKLILPDLLSWLKNNENFVFLGKKLCEYLPPNISWQSNLEDLEKSKKGNLITLISFLHKYPDVRILLYVCKNNPKQHLDPKRFCTILESDQQSKENKVITLTLGYLGCSKFVSLVPKGALNKSKN